MKITPKLTEKITQVCTEGLTKSESKPEIIEKIQAELPRMSLESVMPKKNIIKTAEEEFNLEKTIEEFNDINDSTTLSKICDRMSKDIDEFESKFDTPAGEEIEDACNFHQTALKELNQKYEKLVEKIGNMLSSDNPETAETAMKVFEEQIEPLIQKLQAAFRRVDTRKDVSSSYRTRALLTSINELEKLSEAGKVAFQIEKEKETLVEKDFQTINDAMIAKLEELASKPEEKEIINKEISQQTKHSSVYTDHEINAIRKNIQEATTFDEIAKAAFRIDEMKTANPQLFKEFDEIMQEKIRSLQNEKIEIPKEKLEINTAKAIEEPVNIVAKFEKMDIEAFQAEIEKMTVEDLMSDKLGAINNTLTHYAKTNTEQYNVLSEAFNKKITELSGMM